VIGGREQLHTAIGKNRWPGGILVVLAAVVLLSGSVEARASATTTPPLPYFSLLFSRSEITATDGTACQIDDTNIARTDTVVAPYLAKLGIRATGSIETSPTQTSSFWCAHYGESAAISWNLAQTFSHLYGWSFVSHSATYPTNAEWSSMSSAQLYAETCGSRQAISAHALQGSAGMFAWPGSNVETVALPDVEQCFDVSRVYGGNHGVTSQQQVDAAPYPVSTQGLWGGACNNSALSCYSLPTPVKYVPPGNIIGKLKVLRPGQWLSTQAFILVTGKSPSYQTNATQWDCTSPNPADHWSNDSERYCYNDFQVIMADVHNMLLNHHLVSSDPATIASAFGRSV
jgi:hypothetical protein